jgi:hypothetical protein
MTGTLADLQALRKQHGDDLALYWALTIAIDLVLNIDPQPDMRRLQRHKETI